MGTAILALAKGVLYLVAAPNTRAPYLFPFQFFDFLFAYAFFGLRSAKYRVTASWIAVQLLIQVSVIARNSGTLEAVTRRLLSKQVRVLPFVGRPREWRVYTRQSRHVIDRYPHLHPKQTSSHRCFRK